MPESSGGLGGAGYAPAAAAESVRANRAWWDAAAEDYLAEHGAALGGDRFIWGPEGLDEERAGLLGSVVGRDVLEVGCGAAQCTRWLAAQGARVVGLDLSLAMVRRTPGGRRCPWWFRATPGGCPSPTPASTLPARPTGRCRSSPTRR